MIEALTRRDDLVRLRRGGRRIRHDAMQLTVLVDPSLDGPRVGFAVPRAFGSAVRRNRARRRLRALCRDRARRGVLPSGMYLLTPGSRVLSDDAETLGAAFDEVMEEAVGQ